jgi:hypothetical protein
MNTHYTPSYCRRNRWSIWSIPNSVYHSVCTAAPSGYTLSEKSIRFRYYVQSNKSPNSAQTERNFEEITKSVFSFSVLRILLEGQVENLVSVLISGPHCQKCDLTHLLSLIINFSLHISRFMSL